MTIELEIIEKVLWSGIAAGGFAVLFNVPLRHILPVLLIGAFSGFIKFVFISNGVGIITSVFFAASFVGFVSIPISKFKHTSPFIISIPSIIPMIPGYFGYETLLGIMRLALVKNRVNEMDIILDITHNALNMFFILAALAIGVALPWLLFREKGLKKMKITDEDYLV